MIENIPPRDVWQALRTNPDARLVDVRTDAEWAYVGLPDLSEAGQEPVLIPWQIFPAMQVNAAFVAHLTHAGLQPTQHVYFICRSGVRSLAAAEAAREAGFAHVYNVADGFEGPLDPSGHRGRLAGWKADGLPWRQR
ncbi:Rhodanese-like domain-containing protein [Rhodovastum atsumiense]|uniref:Rhodanese-like domain-containing protein n=1 Tax=Rhodovastum atsumiense TaxID=504468 RepID=A0A5M6IRN3_9PROT|nr:rhodanese-like domain-containing protein [Rhodovastum atsumiense]KAA5610135.1 rhodanese-like domain-containing protein [Rhodovastum atsumiense]CAH2599224.1 Rhodanese-like domain-containing protein [Rhodovastum atsumiense]